jgi:acetaldehyde dehydrogenase/alcohol dehydrogenase
MPLSIKDCGISEEQFMNAIDELSDRAFEDQCTTSNPRMPLVSELKEIYQKAYYGL